MIISLILYFKIAIILGSINCQQHANHSLVFISGWPQSGTSLVNQLLTLSPDISTMVNKCNQIHGKRCFNWNHEGQWLVNSSSLIDLLNPGSMCPINSTKIHLISAETSEHLLSNWVNYWDISKFTLVEKSPHFLLKIPFLYNIFDKKVIEMKFLIILKHPATLNIATERKFEWLTNKNNSNKSITKNTDAEIRYNINKFIDFMLLDQVDSSEKHCDIGWLKSIEILYEQLQSINPNVSIRIIRFEHFLHQPFLLCKGIFQYLYNSYDFQYKHAIMNICNKYFKLPNKKLRNKIKIDHRNLRMREIPGLGLFQFSNEIVESSVSKRLNDFKTALTKATVAQHEYLKKINKRLENYGYSINPSNYLKYKTSKNRLDKWELLNKNGDVTI